MNQAEIRDHINAGANLGLRLLGDAPHMEYTTNEYYACIRPKPGETGGSSIFQVHLEHLPDDQLQQKVDEIRGQNMHVFWGFTISERLINAIWKGRELPLEIPEPNDNEVGMAMLPGDKPAFASPHSLITVHKVETQAQFKDWVKINNEVICFPLVHPENHFHWVRDGIITLYLGCYAGSPAAAAALLTENEIACLDWVGTLEPYRRKGLARATSITAIDEAFSNGAKLITVRPFGVMKTLYRELGFQVYS